MLYHETKLGKLFKGDCLEVMDELIKDGIKVDVVITDPPYGSTNCKWDQIIPFDEIWERINKLTKPNGAIVLFGTEPFSSLLRISNIKNYKYDWVWEKSKATNFLNSKKQPLRAKENISVFYNKQPNYNPQMTEGEAYNKGVRKAQTKDDVYGSFNQVEVKSEGKRYPRDILYFKTAESEGKTFHKTQKPIELIKYLIRTYSNEGDLILDFTSGSGTLALGCEELNRYWICIEKDKDNEGNSLGYCDITVERLKEMNK